MRPDYQWPLRAIVTKHGNGTETLDCGHTIIVTSAYPGGRRRCPQCFEAEPKDLGVHRPPGPLTVRQGVRLARNDKILKMRKEGMSAQKIADSLGVGRSVVRYVLTGWRWTNRRTDRDVTKKHS